LTPRNQLIEKAGMNIQHSTFNFKHPTLDALPGTLRWELNVECSALNVSSLLLWEGARNPNEKIL
jgi:hypothetical protein